MARFLHTIRLNGWPLLPRPYTLYQGGQGLNYYKCLKFIA